MFYRKKTTIEAVQWFGKGHCPIWAQDKVTEHPDCFWIETREGVLKGVPGDWIARGIEGEIYPIADSIFARTYEPVSEKE